MNARIRGPVCALVWVLACANPGGETNPPTDPLDPTTERANTGTATATADDSGQLDASASIPEPDADADGFAGATDRCPDEPGVEPDGCPIRDRDGDGVLDPEDDCVDECETFNGFSDADGCPDDVPEDIKGILGAIPNLKFEFDKATIKRSSYASLDRIVEVLNRHPGLSIVIAGHRDSKGSERYMRVRITRKRAGAVRDYFVSRGVDPARMTFVGYGEERPIASNKTKEGRAKNRRVEIELGYNRNPELEARCKS